MKGEKVNEKNHNAGIKYAHASLARLLHSVVKTKTKDVAALFIWALAQLEPLDMTCGRCDADHDPAPCCRIL